MIDVVFLLLVFFMLAARFGVDQVLPLPLAGSGGDWSGPPRLVDIGPKTVRLNGAPIAEAALGEALSRLTRNPDAPIVLRGALGADVQRLADIADRLTEAGYGALVLVE